METLNELQSCLSNNNVSDLKVIRGGLGSLAVSIYYFLDANNCKFVGRPVPYYVQFEIFKQIEACLVLQYYSSRACVPSAHSGSHAYDIATYYCINIGFWSQIAPNTLFC